MRTRPLVAVVLPLLGLADAFAPRPSNVFAPRALTRPSPLGGRAACRGQRSARRRAKGASGPLMFYSGGGILGVGTPELVVIGAVGYFLLGPTEMYRLAKETGKLVNNVRNILNDSATQWRETLDNELAFKEIQELKQSAQELQEAFTWRQDRCV